jgi:putative transposase
MPRQARIDIPGVYQHVMARGIDGTRLFRTRKDYLKFIDILSDILVSAGDTFIMAWALMPNHFHLLIFMDKTPLSNIMSRLLTKYALYFNKRHGRKGHLFQNRYKSIVCQKDQYLLQLVKYIHLNPLKAKIVPSLRDLDEYEFTGHKALLGKTTHPWQETAEVLKYFSSDALEYRRFIEDGILGSCEFSLDGGGIFKSIKAGGDSLESFQRSHQNHKERFDERILGKGDFVEDVLEKIENHYDEHMAKRSIQTIIDSVIKKHDITKESLILKTPKAQKVKKEIISQSVLSNKHKASQVAAVLGLHRSNVSRILKEISSHQ